MLTSILSCLQASPYLLLFTLTTTHTKETKDLVIRRTRWLTYHCSGRSDEIGGYQKNRGKLVVRGDDAVISLSWTYGITFLPSWQFISPKGDRVVGRYSFSGCDSPKQTLECSTKGSNRRNKDGAYSCDIKMMHEFRIPLPRLYSDDLTPFHDCIYSIPQR
jgi:hypothetical protein